MEARSYEEADYPLVVKWWQKWGWDPIPEEFLPENGVIISNEDVDICAAWLYKTDSGVCWVENYISTFDAPKELRKGAIEALVDELTDLGRMLGYKIIMSSVGHKGLIKKLKSGGFIESDKQMTNLMRVL